MEQYVIYVRIRVKLPTIVPARATEGKWLPIFILFGLFWLFLFILLLGITKKLR